MIPSPQQISGVILAGGRATRLGGQDKGLLELNGKPLVAHVIARLQPQTAALMINANRNQTLYAEFGYPVISDAVDDYAGPLAGMAAAMAAAETDWLVSCPCDGPLLRDDLVKRLAAAVTATSPLVVAQTGEQLQPVYALLHRSLLPSLQHYLTNGGRKVQHWFSLQAAVPVQFGSLEGFENVNTTQDHAALSSAPH